MSFFEEYGEQELYQIDQNTPIEHCLMVSDAAEPEDIDLFWKESVKESGFYLDRQSLFSQNNNDYFLFLLDGSKVVGVLLFNLNYERFESDDDKFPDEITVNFSLKQIFILKRYRGYGLSKMLLDKLIAMLLDEILIPYFERNPVNDDMVVTFYQYSENIECELLSLRLNIRLEEIMNRLTEKNRLPVIDFDFYSRIEEIDNFMINKRLQSIN